MSINIKIHNSYRDVISLCDSNLIGKKFEEGKKQLDIRENFYKGEELKDEEIAEILKSKSKEDSTFNIVGDKAIKIALQSEIISEGSISYIALIPYALKLI